MKGKVKGKKLNNNQKLIIGIVIGVVALAVIAFLGVKTFQHFKGNAENKVTDNPTATESSDDSDDSQVEDTSQTAQTDGNDTALSEIGKSFNYQDAGYIKLGNYKGVSASLEVTDDDVQSEIDSQLEDNKDVEQKQGTIKSGDTVNIDYEGTVDGKAFDGGTDKGYDLEIGSGEFINGFEDQLIGVNVGQTVNINVTFPSDYGDESLNGKAAAFKVTVNYIHGQETKPELNDAFAQKVTDGQCKTVAEYKASVKQQLTQDNTDSLPDTVFQDVIDSTQIIKFNKKELDVSTEQTKKMFQQFADQSGESLDQVLEELGQNMDDSARSAASETMIAKTIASIEGITMDDTYLQTALMKQLDYTDSDKKSLDDMIKEYEETNCTSARDDMLKQKVKEFVAEKASIK